MRRPALDHMARVIGGIYQIAHGDYTKAELVNDIAGLFQGSRACLVTFDTLQWHEVIASVEGTDGVPADEQQKAAFRDPMFPAFMATPLGGLYIERVAIGSARRDPVWDLIRREQDMDDGIGCRLPAPAGCSTFLDVRRGFGQDDFDPADVELLQIIAPHALRARKVELDIRAASLLSLAEASLPFGTMIVDGAERIVTMNAAAETILMRSGAALSARSGYLRVRDAGDAAALRSLIGTVCTVAGDIAPAAGGDLLLRAEHGRSQAPDLVVSVSPFVGPDDRNPWRGVCAVLHLREVRTELPDDFEQYARAAYSFSLKEARLARALAQGHSLRRAAEIEGIAFSTARSYLESIFAKTHCRRQSQLVSLLRAALPPRLL